MEFEICICLLKDVLPRCGTYFSYYYDPYSQKLVLHKMKNFCINGKYTSLYSLNSWVLIKALNFSGVIIVIMHELSAHA